MLALKNMLQLQMLNIIPLWCQIWLLCGTLGFVIMFIQCFHSNIKDYPTELSLYFPLDKNNHFTFIHYTLFLAIDLLFGPICLYWALEEQLGKILKKDNKSE